MPKLTALLGFLIIIFSTAFSMAEQKVEKHELEKFVRERLIESILLYDRHFRIPETGQYLDAIFIDKATPRRIPSSTAATGIGLVSLAIGDALGVVPDAEEKAIKTLSNLLNLDVNSGFKIERSASGWYPHFIDAYSGEVSTGSRNKVSTIDTALLATGTAIAARYFSAKSYTNGKGESKVFGLAGRLVGKVRWSNAIFNVDKGLVHLVFNGHEETPSDSIFANPFDEYSLIPCIAMRGEQLAGRRGPAHDLFFKHYASIEDLPMNDAFGETVIGKKNGNFISHFSHLFAYYYCNNFSGQRVYRQELRELATADRKHFKTTGQGKFPINLWGLGAGAEIKFGENGELERIGYGVNKLDKNPHNTASPAIMAGFAPLFRFSDDDDPIRDLHALWQKGICRYQHQNIGFLWRCSARNPKLKVNKVEAIDFSTYLLGLAGRDSAIGIPFFRHFNL